MMMIKSVLWYVKIKSYFMQYITRYNHRNYKTIYNDYLKLYSNFVILSWRIIYYYSETSIDGHFPIGDVFLGAGEFLLLFNRNTSEQRIIRIADIILIFFENNTYKFTFVCIFVITTITNLLWDDKNTTKSVDCIIVL